MLGYLYGHLIGRRSVTKNQVFYELIVGYQYVALGGFMNKEQEHHLLGVKQDASKYPMEGAINIMRMDPTKQDGVSLAVCILHSHGCVHDLSWYQYGADLANVTLKLISGASWYSCCNVW